MKKVFKEFLLRNTPALAENIFVDFVEKSKDYYCITAKDGNLYITANNVISACNGYYMYLRKYCNVQYSWCGNRKIDVQELTMFDGEFCNEIEQKFRVYMNYCTLNYSMSFWDFSQWEREIDFMAMNGINMPLGVIGSEAVLYETLLQYDFTKEEALNAISGPCFMAWQWMTNIMGYLPPSEEKYVYERLELGKQILARYLEFGMTPIQQGFSGHVPKELKEKRPKAKILIQSGWCNYPKTAQLDPLDPLFFEYGTAYLKNLERLMGNHHYLACDPFHEGTPPKPWAGYLAKVGRAIDNLYKQFDPQSTWVMQAWSLRKHIVRAVPKDRLLILDLNSLKTKIHRNLWGYPVVEGMLHDFGGKNSMQGKLAYHAKNVYLTNKNNGANVVGSGMFMEGIEQNPVVYDLQFELLTTAKSIDINEWLDNYITRRYGKYNETLRKAWDLLLQTCYSSDLKYEENSVGATIPARPQLLPHMTGPCCVAKPYYNVDIFADAVKLFAQVADEFKDSDGYQYDLCDLTRQAMDNKFYKEQQEYSKNFQTNNLQKLKQISSKQLDLILDLDELTDCRTEMTLSKWINDAHNLATDEKEKKYFDINARTLLTLWGDINGNVSALYDYAWREWSGLIKEYYYPRWQMFYEDIETSLEKGTPPIICNLDNYLARHKYNKFPLGKKLYNFEINWINAYKEYPLPANKDCISHATECIKKWL